MADALEDHVGQRHRVVLRGENGHPRALRLPIGRAVPARRPPRTRPRRMPRRPRRESAAASAARAHNPNTLSGEPDARSDASARVRVEPRKPVRA